MSTHPHSTDYAHAAIHNQPLPEPEPCQNVMDMGGSTGENAVVCGLDCWLFCEACEVSACSRSCARELGCTHLERAA